MTSAAAGPQALALRFSPGGLRQTAPAAGACSPPLRPRA